MRRSAHVAAAQQDLEIRANPRKAGLASGTGAQLQGCQPCASEPAQSESALACGSGWNTPRRNELGRTADVSDATTLTSTIAGRYATALFELAVEQGALDQAEADVAALKSALGESADLSRLISSPIYGRADQARAMSALAGQMGLGSVVSNLIGVMAQKRRLFVLPGVLEIFGALLAEHRGEVTAKVTAARLLTDEQIDALKSTLKQKLERDVKLDIMIDPAIIGGLIVKVGSRMIDTSIRSKLAGLQNAMREVG